MSPRASGTRTPEGAASDASDGSPSLAAGYLVALPLFAAYELGVHLAGSEGRASAERVMAWGLAFLDERLQGARVALLVAAALLACARVRGASARGEGEPWRALVRGLPEGLLAGFLLAPLLTVLHGWLTPEPLPDAPEPVRSLAASLRLVGAAPWEELLFRVGLYGGLFLAVRRTLGFLGLAPRAALLPAELAALLGSSLLFAVFHLDGAQRVLGAHGEPFHAGLFLWRVSAGILLAGLFRWRSFGVAAWAHALFNLGIALGVRP